MDQLTPFERGLLEQFRKLASEFDQSQSASEELSGKLADWSRAISKRQAEIETRLKQIEATQKRLTDALSMQNSSTSRLVEQVSRLLSVPRS